MDSEDGRYVRTMSEGRRILLTGQLRLLDVKREEVLALRGRGGGGSSYVEALVDDLVGARLVVLSAALLSDGPSVAEREQLEGREREARGLLRETWALGSAERGTRIALEPSRRPVSGLLLCENSAGAVRGPQAAPRGL